MATLFLAIALLGAWFVTITHSDADALANANNRRVTPSGDATKEPAEFTFVGHVNGMVDCEWADPSTSTIPGAGVTLGRRYALKSGLMEITYQSGAKVILQGPCEYKVESTRGGFLQVGKLVARVGEGSGVRGQGAGDKKVASGEWRVASAANPKSQIPNPKSEIPKSPNPQIPKSLFSIRTPTALVEDLGTEFGVEVSDSGETASHVFQGRVVMRTEGAGGGGRGAGDEKSQIPNPTSEILLSASQSARVEKDAKSGELKLHSGEKNALIEKEPAKFVRRLREPPKLLDLLDIVAGGNGTGHRRERGINATTAQPDLVYDPILYAGNNRYCRVSWHEFIDGVFVPDGRKGTTVLNSTGDSYCEFPATSGNSYGLIWSRAVEIESYRKQEKQAPWIYTMDCCDQFMPHKRGLLCFCPNAGITFNLDAIRRAYRGVKPTSFSAIAGIVDNRRRMPTADAKADIWIFVDGRLAFHRKQLRPDLGVIEVEIHLDDNDHFISLVSTDGGNGYENDYVVFGDPALNLGQ